MGLRAPIGSFSPHTRERLFIGELGDRGSFVYINDYTLEIPLPPSNMIESQSGLNPNVEPKLNGTSSIQFFQLSNVLPNLIIVLLL